MKLFKHKSYKADVALSGLEIAAPNGLVELKLTQLGFQQVKVNGSGSRRHATGIWIKEDQVIEVPSQVKNLVEVEK